MSVTVVGPNARRVKVAVTPNTTLQEVLTKTCSDLSLDVEQYDLLHQHKALDLSLTIRFANLSNNAQLDLKKLNAPRVQSNVSVAVQSESGQRTTGLFMPDSSLYQVIAETSGFPAVKKGQQVVCLFTRREIVGENSLKSTTLKSLGLNSGSVVLRILVRDESVLGAQAYVEDLRLKKDAGKSTASEKISDVKQNVSKSFKSLKKMVSNAFESIEKSTEPSNSKNKSQSESGGHRLGSSYDKPSLSESSSQASVPSSATPAASSSQSSQRVDSSPSEAKQVAAEINFIGERDALIFSHSDIPKMHSSTDIDDSFFEITKDDVMVMYQDLKDQVRQLENRPPETSRLRELKDSKTSKKYTKAVLRIFFPHDGFVIQANFSPNECISHVVEFIRPFLTDKSMDFYLFTTPPKVILKSDATIHALKLVPAANIHFGYNSQAGVLKPDLSSKVTPFEAIISATSKLRAQIASTATPDDREVIDAPTETTKLDQQPETDQPAASGYVPRVQTSQDKVPKWFKKGK